MASSSAAPHFPSGKPKVVVTRHLMPAVEARMSELFDTALNLSDAPMSEEALSAAMADCDVLVPTVTDRITGPMIENAGERLRLIASFGAGTEHIDLAAAAQRRIIVTNTPGVFTDDTADLTMAAIIGVPRRIREGTQLVRRGEWTGWAPSGLLGRKLGGKVLGIVGMGRIGQAVAHRARAFGLEVAYYNRKRLPEAVEGMLGVRYVGDVDTLVSEADILTLHCPLTQETRAIAGF
ncbi:MAG: NAD(P)-dependent oxidoreductase, partial [Pseudomonadota bacterium]